ncbi:MAG TPA: hypothetical protein VFV96_18760 [Verrucomicrobiae bacterium]|nr:hypothetical protein [Verrucomicrobiae bacterium]
MTFSADFAPQIPRSVAPHQRFSRRRALAISDGMAATEQTTYQRKQPDEKSLPFTAISLLPAGCAGKSEPDGCHFVTGLRKARQRPTANAGNVSGAAAGFDRPAAPV